MNNKIFLANIVFMTIISSCIVAQGLDKNDIIGSAGVGTALNYADVEHFGLKPAVRLTCEKEIFEIQPGVVSIGGIFGFSTQSESGKYEELTYFGIRRMSYTWYYYQNIFGLRSAWHYNFRQYGIEQLNVYGGASLGFRYEFAIDSYTGDKVSFYDPPNSRAYPYISIFVGASYSFNDKWAAFVEAGFDLSLTTIGIIYRFN
ncbi:MAG: hypothetical protein HY738_01915 [Bacteroidia bacterium]|nr:hypothetical protein [Bacteroidia bacterium]